MNKANEIIGGVTGTAISFAGVTIENIDHLVSIICGVIGLCITIVTCIVIPLIRKVLEAKKDGKIDDKEMDEIINTIEDGAGKVKDEIDKINKGGK